MCVWGGYKHPTQPLKQVLDQKTKLKAKIRHKLCTLVVTFTRNETKQSDTAQENKNASAMCESETGFHHK